MDMTPFEQLDELYATLPTVECKRLCQAYCGPLLIPKIEHCRLEEKRGFIPLTAGRVTVLNPEWKWMRVEELAPVRPDDGLKCRMLMPVVGTCSVYKIRPLICRLWGMVDTPLLRCPYGCVPDRWLTNADVKLLMEKVLKIQNAT